MTEHDEAERGPDAGFLEPPTASAAVQRLYDGDLEGLGYVMNASRLWAHQPALLDGLFDVVGAATKAAGLTDRQRGILITACASTLGDSYCALAWGQKLAGEASSELAAAVLRGDDEPLDPGERVLAQWARQVAGAPNETDARDVQALRDAGFDDAQILAITVFVTLRLAFSTVNDTLGARPDHALVASVPGPVLEAVTYGRPPADGHSENAS